MSEIVHPYSDIFVRYLLGDENNKDLLLSFINAVHEDYDLPLIAEITIKNPFNLKTYKVEKESVIDVKGYDEKGRLYDIEVQTAGNEAFKYRSLYYWAKVYASQISAGDKYQLLKPAICINLLNFSIIENSDVHSCFLIREMKNPELILTDHLIIHFLELLKFLKMESFQSRFEKWMAYFKFEGRREEIMETIIKDDEIFSKAHDRYRQFTLNDELMELYEARIKYQLQYNTDMAYAEEKGIEKGIQKGIEKGELLDKQNVLIRQLGKKFGITEDEKTAINTIKDCDVLDKALDVVLFATTKQEVLTILGI